MRALFLADSLADYEDVGLVLGELKYVLWLPKRASQSLLEVQIKTFEAIIVAFDVIPSEGMSFLESASLTKLSEAVLSPVMIVTKQSAVGDRVRNLGYLQVFVLPGDMEAMRKRLGELRRPASGSNGGSSSPENGLDRDL